MGTIFCYCYVLVKGPSPRISSPVKQDSSVATPTITISTEVAFIEKTDASEMIDEEAEAYEDAQQVNDIVSYAISRVTLL